MILLKKRVLTFLLRQNNNMKKWEDTNKTFIVKTSDDFSVLDIYKEEILDTRIVVSGISEQTKKAKIDFFDGLHTEIAVPDIC